jgi:hypothetical protein
MSPPLSGDECAGAERRRDGTAQGRDWIIKALGSSQELFLNYLYLSLASRSDHVPSWLEDRTKRDFRGGLTLAVE